MANATRIILLGLGLALNGMCRQEYTRNFDQAVNLKQGQPLRVEHTQGDIDIRTHPQQDLTIHAEIHVSAGDQNKAEQFANRIQILTEPSSPEFLIRTRYPESPNGWFGDAVSYSVRYEITIPENTPLSVRNAFGAVSIAGLKADGNITTSHGAIVFRDGKGAQRLDDSFGRVELTNNVGSVTIQNTNGTVKVADVSGALTIVDRFASISADRIGGDLTITNTNGTVDVADCRSAARIKNAFANVTARNISGDLTIHNGNGRVEAANVQGSAELDTSFGEIRFSEIGRTVWAHANNSAIQGTKVKGAVKIANSFGRVAVTEVDGPLDVQSGNGEVSVSEIHNDATLKTSFASVDAADVAGALNVIDSNGSVKAKNVRTANVKTSFGGVMLQQIPGAITVENQNGGVEANTGAANACQPITIHTSFSPIRVQLNTNASYRVSAATSFGKIESEFPLTISGTASKDSLNGSIGDGRCDLKLTDRNGTIQILKSGSH